MQPVKGAEHPGFPVIRILQPIKDAEHPGFLVCLNYATNKECKEPWIPCV